MMDEMRQLQLLARAWRLLRIASFVIGVVGLAVLMMIATLQTIDRLHRIGGRPMSDRPTPDRFAVYQFFADDTNECIGESLDAQNAVLLARRYCRSLGAKLGTTRRVIIADSGDCTVFEWQHGKGVTFPEECAGMQPEPPT